MAEMEIKKSKLIFQSIFENDKPTNFNVGISVEKFQAFFKAPQATVNNF